MIGWRQFSFIIFLFLLSIAAACNGDGAAPSTTDQENGAASGIVTTCQDAISWDEAYQHVGEVTTVEGPVMSPRYAESSSGQPTFLNIGRPFPDPDRFTVVIWGDDRGNFQTPPEQAYDRKTICVTGLIESFEGSPEIIADSPSDIEVVE